MTETTSERAIACLRRARLTDEEWHGLLTSARRRIVLDLLAGHDGAFTLDDLAEKVATRAGSVDTPGDVRQTKISLHHHHLPKMDALGVLEYDWDAGTIRSVE